MGLGLQQVLSPQMQQSLQVLQVPALELRALVDQELQVNPLLEMQETEVKDDADEAEPSDDSDYDDDLEEVNRLDDEWRDYMAQSGAYEGRSSEAEERREFLMNSLYTPQSLQEFLLEQLRLADLSGDDWEVVEAIVGNLNDAGILDVTIPELCGMTNQREENVLRVLREVQALEPTGVAALDLRECLLIQLRRLGKEESLEWRIVSGHLDELLRRKFPDIAKRLGTSVHDVQTAADFISTLEPRPARQFSTNPEQIVLPDVIVEPEADGFAVSLVNDSIPILRISNYYKDLLATPGNRGQVRDYIRDKIKGGRFFIKCIQQRQQTILNLANEIVAKQEEFMRHGPGHLRPLTMNQVAQAVGVHETTVSRATHGKYMQTPHGVYELKYFFTPGYQTDEGEGVSNESVRRAIVELIEKEDRRKPLSDQAILEILKDRGIPIARRTVAKYREQLDILPSHLRRSF